MKRIFRVAEVDVQAIKNQLGPLSVKIHSRNGINTLARSTRRSIARSESHPLLELQRIVILHILQQSAFKTTLGIAAIHDMKK